MDRWLSSSGSLARRIAACLGTVLLALPLLGIPAAVAQTSSADEVVIFVLDLSGSMNEPFDANRTKLDVAKAAFVEAFANVSPDSRVGLRTYGDQLAPTSPDSRESSCSTDTRSVASVAPLQREQLIAQVQGFSARGDTPMGLALQQASGDIPAGSTGTIVLFSDGRDECFDADLDGDPATGPSYGQDPCEIAKQITAGEAAVDRVVTVGFRADSAAETELRCIAQSTGGSYTAIETPEDARDALPNLLVQLSAPREAQRLVGRAIEGSTATDTAPDLVRLDEIGADTVLYTDSIDMNSVRIYRAASYGPEGGTFTATVFGLPAELGITLDMRIYVPSLDQRFFQGEHGDTNAGLPARQTASIRCTDCKISGGPYEAFFVVTLDSENPNITGTYELELLTEGPGFGGPTTSCSPPQACFYPQEIIDQRAELDAIDAELAGGVGEMAPPELIAERNRLRDEIKDSQDAIDAANATAAELEARIPLAPGKSNSFRIPLLMIVVGLALAVAPIHKLKREPKTDDDDDAGDGEDDGDAAATPTAAAESAADPSLQGSPAPAPERAGPSLDVGPPPAVSPHIKGTGNAWEAELEAAKEALAQQRPARTDGAPESPLDNAVQSPPADKAPGQQFTAAQHAEAQAAAQRIAAQRAAEQRESAESTNQPTSTAPPPGPGDGIISQQSPPHPAPAVQPVTPEQIAALQGGATPAVSEVAPPTATQQPAQQPAATEQPAAEQAATEEAARQAAQAATAQAATEEAARQAAAQAATEEAARQAAAQAATEEAARQAAAQAAQLATEEAARQAAEQAATEEAERQAAAQAAQLATEEAARQAAEQAAREKAEREAAEQAAREKAEREAAEQAAREKAEREAAEQAAREKAEREAAEQAAREKAEREAAEQAAREKAEREAAEQAAREKAEREAAEQAAREKAEREAAEQAAREKAAAEQAARLAAERLAAERAAAEKAAAERAAAEEAARQAAAQAAADRAAAEKAAAERAAAEEAARQAAAQAAADRAAAEKAAAERAAAEEAARRAAEERTAAEQAAREAAQERATQEAASAEAAASRAKDGSSTTPSAPAKPMTEEEQRQEARRRMLAKQNIVASSSSGGNGGGTTSGSNTAGTAAALRPMTVPPAAEPNSRPVERSTPTTAGWYDDPAIVGQYRWWDGATWTGHTAADDKGAPPA